MWGDRVEYSRTPRARGTTATTAYVHLSYWGDRGRTSPIPPTSFIPRNQPWASGIPTPSTSRPGTVQTARDWGSKVYLDGKRVDNQAVTGPVGFLYPVSVTMGKHGNGKQGYEFVGSLDEPQIHSVARDADGVKLTYENQRPGGGVPITGPYICAIGGRGPGA